MGAGSRRHLVPGLENMHARTDNNGVSPSPQGGACPKRQSALGVENMHARTDNGVTPWEPARLLSFGAKKFDGNL